VSLRKYFVSQIFSPPRHEEEQTISGHSYRHILKGISTAIAGRGVAILANFFAIPLTIRYLGSERYGVWVTLTSILSYLTIFDLGIGSTAINGISDALAKGKLESAKQKINTTYLTLLGTALLIGVGVCAAWPMIAWPIVLGDKTGANAHEVTIATGIAIAIVLASFPLAATPRIMGACRKITLSNYWNALGSLLSLLAIVLATRLQTGLPGLVVAVSGCTLIVGVFSTIWLYRHYDWLTFDFRDIRWERTRELLNTGLPFFAVQVAGFVLLQTDNLIIAQILGAAAVTPYSITSKLFAYASLLPVIALPSLWPAYSDAFARRDLPWIRKTYRYNVLLVIGSTATFVLVLFMTAKRFISIWAGPDIVPTSGLIIGMGIWTIVASLSWCQTGLLGAAGQVRGQAIYSAIGAIVNVIASIICGRLFGLTGIIMGTLIAYLVCIIVPQTLEVRKVLTEKYA